MACQRVKASVPVRVTRGDDRSGHNSRRLLFVVARSFNSSWGGLPTLLKDLLCTKQQEQLSASCFSIIEQWFSTGGVIK